MTQSEHQSKGADEMKQATHVSIGKITDLTIRVGELGGYIVFDGGSGRGDDYGSYRQCAAFSNADQCADYVRSHLRNVAALKFGAKKTKPTE